MKTALHLAVLKTLCLVLFVGIIATGGVAIHLTHVYAVVTFGEVQNLAIDMPEPVAPVKTVKKGK